MACTAPGQLRESGRDPQDAVRDARFDSRLVCRVAARESNGRLWTLNDPGAKRLSKVLVLLYTSCRLADAERCLVAMEIQVDAP